MFLIYLDVSKDTSKNNYDTVEKIKKIIGEPRNYGPTDEEREEMRKAAVIITLYTYVKYKY